MIDLKEYQFSELMDGFFDGPHATPTPSDKGPVFLGIKNIKAEGGIELSQIRHISENEYPKWTKRVVPKKNDLVFSYEATLHRYALIPDGFRGCLGRRMALIRANKELLDPTFLYYYFLSPYWKAFIETVKISGATVDRISIIDFPNLKISIPNLETQIKISNTVSSYDDLIENNNLRIKLLENMAEEIYKEWFVRFRFPGYKEATFLDKEGIQVTHGTKGAIPEGWSMCKVSGYGNVITGKTPSKNDDSNFDGNIPFIKTPDMGQGMFFTKTEESLSDKGANSQKNQFVPENTICVSCIGTVGKLAITTTLSQTNQQINSVIPKESYFLEYLYFSFLRLKPVIESYAATGATMANLSKSKFENLKLLKPEYIYIEEYSKIVFSFFEEIKILLSKNKILQETRDLLLPRLISGKLSVEDLEM
jgi:type I restriction enzyme S subunit